MSGVGFILLGLAACYCLLCTRGANRAYSRGFGDGYNYAADRAGRTIRSLLESIAELTGRIAPVPASREVAAEEQRRAER